MMNEKFFYVERWCDEDITGNTEAELNEDDLIELRKRISNCFEDNSYRNEQISQIIDEYLEETRGMNTKHPNMCYIFIPTENAVGIVKWGEAGYYKTNYPNNFTKEIVDELNEVRGISPRESSIMKALSMNESANGDLNKWQELWNNAMDKE